MAARQLDRFDGLSRRELDGGLIVVSAETRRSRNLGLARLDELPADWGLFIPTARPCTRSPCASDWTCCGWGATGGS